jgi:predicted transcriptional regulator
MAKKQVSLALDAELIAKLDVLAAEEDRSRSWVAERLISEALRAREVARGEARREGSSS